jgi:hypothetical protein
LELSTSLTVNYSALTVGRELEVGVLGYDARSGGDGGELLSGGDSKNDLIGALAFSEAVIHTLEPDEQINFLSGSSKSDS